MFAIFWLFEYTVGKEHWEENMSDIILYRGSSDQRVIPKFGLGEDRHDYGKGFYLTESIDFAVEKVGAV